MLYIVYCSLLYFVCCIVYIVYCIAYCVLCIVYCIGSEIFVPIAEYQLAVLICATFSFRALRNFFEGVRFRCQVSRFGSARPVLDVIQHNKSPTATKSTIVCTTHSIVITLGNKSLNDVQMMYKWFPNDVNTMSTWCTNVVQMMYKWCTNDVQMMYKWCANDVNTISTWCTNDF